MLLPSASSCRCYSLLLKIHLSRCLSSQDVVTEWVLNSTWKHWNIVCVRVCVCVCIYVREILILLYFKNTFSSYFLVIVIDIRILWLLYVARTHNTLFLASSLLFSLSIFSSQVLRHQAILVWFSSHIRSGHCTRDLV